MSVDEIMYKKKYLKYKAKYVELKTIEQQGGLLDSGYAIVFTSTQNSTKLKEAFGKGSISGKGSIADILDKEAYIIFDGKKYAELMESNSRIMKDNLYSATAVASSALNTAATGAMSIASTAATGAVSVASTATNSVVNQYTKYQDSVQQEAAKKAAEKAEFEKFKAQQANATSASSVVAPASAVVAPAIPVVAPAISVAKSNIPVAKSNTAPVPPSAIVEDDEGDLTGGDGLPKTIKTLDNKSFDRANENHKNYIKNAVAIALGLNVDNVNMSVVEFKMFGKPELKY